MSALDVARDRMAAQLADAGRPFAAFAATVLVCRGVLLLDAVAFASLLGVPVDHLRRLESGRRPPDHAPRRLSAVCPDLDWEAVGVDPTDPADRARRHPSAGARPRAGREDGPP
jgi:hypothetical protein